MTEKIRRKYYLDKLLSYKDKDIIKVVTGLRRSGKVYFGLNSASHFGVLVPPVSVLIVPEFTVLTVPL